MKTLKEYMEGLDEFAKEHPEALELQVITATDDEGNGYNAVHYEPALGHYDNHEFDRMKEANEDGSMKPNAVCVN